VARAIAYLQAMVELGEADVDPQIHTPGRDRGSVALRLFSVMWAAAAVWHILGNVSGSGDPAHLALALAAGLVLAVPACLWPLALLAGTTLWTAWVEAPMLSNHWLLSALVGLAILVSALVAVARNRDDQLGGFERAFFPAARLSLIVFYLFAGFSKLNSAFFDRSVSCGVFYFNESTASLGLGRLVPADRAALQMAVIVGTAAIELAIPWLLIVRSTRHWAVLVALVFHAVLALDRKHQFFDFSSMLAALFVLFLPVTFAPWIGERLERRLRPMAARVDLRPEVLRWVAAAAVSAAGLAAELGVLSRDQSRMVGWWTWQAAAVTLIAAVGIYLVRVRPAPSEARTTRSALVPAGVVVVVPLLVMLNGLTPYLELKTGFGWNMYSNLRTVDGDSNHLIVRATAPLTSQQQDLITIVSSDDPGLQWYVDRDYALTRQQARIYLARHPDVSITYKSNGRTVRLARASDQPDLVEPVPVWREKLQLFRAVDLTSSERCGAYWGPAR